MRHWSMKNVKKHSKADENKMKTIFQQKQTFTLSITDYFQTCWCFVSSETQKIE